MSGWIELVVMDTWRPFRNAVGKHARGADMVFDKLHIMWHLSNTPDQIRHDEFKRLQGAGQSYPKGQRHTPPRPATTRTSAWSVVRRSRCRLRRICD